MILFEEVKVDLDVGLLMLVNSNEIDVNIHPTEWQVIWSSEGMFDGQHDSFLGGF